MKRYMRVAAAVFVLGWAWSFGAYFVYDSSSMWAQSQSIAEDVNETYDSETQVDWKDGNEDSNVSVSSSAYTLDDDELEDTAYCSASAWMEYWLEAGLGLSMNAYAEAWTYDDDATATTYAGTSTVEPGYSTGLFFKIMPDEGERVGDTVEVSMSWSGSAVVNISGTAISNAGYLNNDSPGSPIVVALNPSNKSIPEAVSRVWEYDFMEQIGDGYQNGSDSEAGFTAKIGDVIGIFAGVHAGVEVSGEDGYGYADASHEFTFSLEYIGRIYTVEDADITGDGLVNLEDLAVLAEFWLQTVYLPM